MMEEYLPGMYQYTITVCICEYCMEETGVVPPVTWWWSIDEEQGYNRVGYTRVCQGREVWGGAFNKGKWDICWVAYGYPSVHGAVFWNRRYYGPVRCGFKKEEILRCGSVRFSEIRDPTVRFGAVFRYRKSYGAVRCCDISYGAVRRGSPLNGFSTVRLHSP